MLLRTWSRAIYFSLSRLAIISTVGAVEEVMLLLFEWWVAEPLAVTFWTLPLACGW